MSEKSNPISKLYEYAQHAKLPISIYEKVRRSTALAIRLFGSACGSSKKEAKTEAAEIALESISSTRPPVTSGAHNKVDDDANVPLANCTNRKRKLKSITAINPVSELNELKQSKRMKIDWEVKAVGPPHAPTFTAQWIVGDEKYPEASGRTKKKAKEEAARLTLQLLKPSDRLSSGEVGGALYESNKLHIENADAFHDFLAASVCNKYKELVTSSCIQMPGRLFIAGFVMSITSEGCEPEYTVITIGTGNRCIGGDKMSLRGETVFDSHAEIVARRGLVRFFIDELENGKRGIFLKSETGKCQLKPNIKFHLYISTAPCGDSAIFSPSDESTDSQQQAATSLSEHHPKFQNSKQGMFRTKVEKGEGCIPVDENDNVPTYDGIIKGERLRTMSCSDKIAKWNFLGLQGSLLTQFLEPIYLSSLTLGTLYNHGHLARAVCCRLEKAASELQLPHGYKINHPVIGRVSFNHENRETGKMKTKEYSCNWSLGDNVLEVLDGTTGRCEARFGCDSVSRICKAKIFEDFKRLSSKYKSFNLLGSTYADTKLKALQYHSIKKSMFEAIFQCKMGTWMKKPVEINQF